MATERSQVGSPSDAGWAYALDFLDEPVCVLDLQDRVIHGNRAFYQRIGKTREAVVGTPVAQYFHPHGEERPCEVCRARLERRDAVVTIEADDPHNRAGKPMEIRIGIVRDAAGEPIAVVQRILDLSAIRAAEQRLRKSEAWFKELFESSPDAHVIVNELGEIKNANSRCLDVLGYRPSELIGKMAECLLPMESREKHKLDRDGFRQNPVARPMGQSELVALHKDGTLVPVEISLSPIDFDDGHQVSVVIRDISERKRSERELKRLASYPKFNPMPVIEISASGEIQYLNPATKKLFFDIEKKAAEHPIFSGIFDLIPDLRAGEQPLIRDVQVGSAVYEQQISYFPDTDSIRIYLWDITEIRALANKMTYQATHDSLTGLVNRSEFERRLHNALDEAVCDHSEHALCYIDLDQFKIINDRCGHLAGDQLLKQLSQLLQKTVRHGDTFARLGGDEFGLLLLGCPVDNAVKIAEAFRKTISDYRFTWQNKTFKVGASIGVVAVNEQFQSRRELMQAVDSACYFAKDQGRDRVHLYKRNDAELGRYTKRLEWAHKVQQALEEDRFVLFKQEIRALSPRAESYFEILLRMQGDKGELIAPGSFLPAVERFNLSIALDRWVISKTFRLIKQGCFGDHQCSINLSGESLGNTTMIGFIIGQLDDTGIDAEQVCFEITETAMIPNLATGNKFISTLKGVGFRFALDDFGSGVSSFSYLQNLAVDQLKIDGSLVRDVAENHISAAMVRAINEIGHAMGLTTVAEFVENEAILSKISDFGIDYAQGYHFGRPIPAAS